MSGELAPGQPLVEIPLAESCNVSRTPIREALTRLQQDGLAQRTDHGLVVRERTPSEIIDLYDTRIVLEAKAAVVAAQRYTLADMISVRRTAETYSNLNVDDAGALADANREFHRSIWLASHNQSLIDLLERLNMHLGRHPITTLGFPGRRAASIDEHQRLVSAIADRDTEAASEVAREHFTAALEIRLKLLERG